MPTPLQDLVTELRRRANPQKAKILQGFFKTKKGEYGYGDIFLGITVPEQRKVAGKYSTLPRAQLTKLLHSKIHEHRLTALLILVLQFKKADKKTRDDIVALYLRNTKYINNWDLVDSSAKYILGEYLISRDRSILYTLVRSKNIWERRIAIIATHHFIANNDFKDALELTKILLTDTHDLIHKACGWMLREVGKRNRAAETEFLERYASRMPRTMLRYALEHYPPKVRLLYMKNPAV